MVYVKISQQVAMQESKDYTFCFVGQFLTDKLINFIAMKNTLASVWESGKGITVIDVGEGRYLFRLFHKVDVNVLI